MRRTVVCVRRGLLSKGLSGEGENQMQDVVRTRVESMLTYHETHNGASLTAAQNGSMCDVVLVIVARGDPRDIVKRVGEELEKFKQTVEKIQRREVN